MKKWNALLFLLVTDVDINMNLYDIYKKIYIYTY